MEEKERRLYETERELERTKAESENSRKQEKQFEAELQQRKREISALKEAHCKHESDVSSFARREIMLSYIGVLMISMTLMGWACASTTSSPDSSLLDRIINAALLNAYILSFR